MVRFVDVATVVYSLYRWNTLNFEFSPVNAFAATGYDRALSQSSINTESGGHSIQFDLVYNMCSIVTETHPKYTFHRIH